MPTFRVTDPQTGQTLELTGNTPPTEQELEAAFARQPTQTRADQQSALLQRLAEQPGAFEAGAIAAGRGLTGLGRAVGLVEPEDPLVTEAFERLQKERPVATEVGEVVGETVPFLLPATGVGAIPALATRIPAAIGLGVTEGGLIAKSRGGDEITGGLAGGAIAGTFEAAFPVIGRLGSALIRRVKGTAPKGAVLDAAGKPSAELVEALEATGQTFDDLSAQATETLRKTTPGADPQEAARLARLESLRAPATKGDITQEFAQQAQEARLVESAADVLGDPLRALRLEQSRAFKGQLDAQVEKLGVPADVGDTIKSALEGRKKLLSKEKNALYKQVAETSPEIRSAPILTDNIIDAMPADREIRRLSRIQGNQAGAVDDLLVEFGISKDPSKVEKFIDAGGKIDQLNIGNFDEFRQALNQIEKADTTRSTSVIIGPIKRALDEEAGLIDDALTAAGIVDESVLAPLKQARATVRQIKTEFSPEAISGRLIKAKRDGVTPLVESSKVFTELMGGQKAPELVERTIESLSKTPAGKKAIGDLQARTIVDLLENAFKAEGRKVGAEKVFGGIAFNKRLQQIGDRRLNAVFSTRPDVLKKIKTVGEAAKDITPPSGAIPKGSASVILDSLNRLGIMSITTKVPGGALLAETIRTIADKGANRQVLEKALNAKPNVKRMATFLANDAPSIATPLGISFLATTQEEK